MRKTKIVNVTTRDLAIKEKDSDAFRHLANVPPMQAFNVYDGPYRDCMLVVGNDRIYLDDFDLSEAIEIRVYETPSQKVGYRVSIHRTFSGKVVTDFDVAKRNASSRVVHIEKSRASLVTLKKQAKICPAQCQNLVQTCLGGVKEMRKAYDEKSDDDMWQIYHSKKLQQLISFLDKLLSTLRSIQDLLQDCGNDWGSMALVVSLPLPPCERVSSKFDILIKELHWNLETIHYALHWNGCVEFKWNDRMFRYALETITGAKVTIAEDMELDQSRRLAFADRENLLSQLQSGSILVPGNSSFDYFWWHLGYKFATDQWRVKLAAELQKRLNEAASVISNNSCSIPDGFWINNVDLELRTKLSGSRYASKSVWKGEWCGQAVAIGITKYDTKAAVEKEAGLMLKVQHPNVVGFLGCSFAEDAPPQVRRYKKEKCSAAYLVMELMKEDLRHFIDSHAKSPPGNPFPLAVTVDILLQITGAMAHMHNLNIMHRDLKSANCLVEPRFNSSNSSSPVLKLIDFDRSKALNPNSPISDHTPKPGTLRWMAPEVLGLQISEANSSERPRVPYTRSADVWSFGMICYEVVTGLLPFHDCGSNADLENALRDGRRPSIPASVRCPDGLKALMSRCWAQEPSDRPGFKDLEKDLWTIKYESEMQYSNSEQCDFEGVHSRDLSPESISETLDSITDILDSP